LTFERNAKYQEVMDLLGLSMRQMRPLWKEMPHTYMGVRHSEKRLTLRMARFNLDEVRQWAQDHQAQS
jgi:hypothetical protein